MYGGDPEAAEMRASYEQIEALLAEAEAVAGATGGEKE